MTTIEDVITPERARELIERGEGFTVQESTGCWIYEHRAPSGYGPFLAFFVGRYGQVPVGLHPVFVCGGGPRGCVNPEHLDLLPDGERPARRDPRIGVRDRGFAQRLRDEREARAMSRRDFAKELRVSPRTLTAWERGDRFPPADVLEWIVRYLGWDGQPRRWLVTYVAQRVIEADSSGAAVRALWDEIDRHQADPRKTAVYSVKQLR